MSYAFWKGLENLHFARNGGIRYHLTRMLDFGSFGAVYRADRIKGDALEKEVAIKVFRIDFDVSAHDQVKDAQAANLSHKLNELQIQARIQHDYIVATPEHGCGAVNLGSVQGLFLELELADSDLAKHPLYRSQGTSLDELRRMVEDICTALAFLHDREHPVIHRDIKPSNLLWFAGQRRWKLGDLGLARIAAERDRPATTEAIGTMHYMAPEMFHNQVVPESDIWALGVTICEILTGRFPFGDGISAKAPVMRQILDAPPDFHGVTLPKPFDRIVSGCLQKDWRKRWSARRILKELELPGRQDDPAKSPGTFATIVQNTKILASFISYSVKEFAIFSGRAILATTRILLKIVAIVISKPFGVIILSPLRAAVTAFAILLLSGILLFTGIFYVFYKYGKDLPDYHQLAHYEPPITTRAYGDNGEILAEFSIEHRVFVPIDAVPQIVKAALISAEDKRFWDHPGIDFLALGRAIAATSWNKITADGSASGGSTITQQVARNFLLTGEASLERKAKEILLAFRMERAFTKEHILELYLNEIYFGEGSYGIAAAALKYFNKGLDELTVAEAAYLAALPKAPNNHHPLRNPQAAKERRDWVIGRMLEDGMISSADAQAAKAEPLVMRPRPPKMIAGADYFAEHIRHDLSERYGEDALYKGGLVIRATVDAELQSLASRTLREGLVAYDQRLGWRGPVTNIASGSGSWADKLASIPIPKGAEPWDLAVVLSVSDRSVNIGLKTGQTGSIPIDAMKWAHRRPSKLLSPGDVVLVEATEADGNYALRQVPEIDGALVAMDPHTGRVLALAGGWSFDRSKLNRATEVKRQPGSAFTPFISLAALDNGYTPSSLVLDAPIALPQGPGRSLWRPKNNHDDYLGPTTLRVGIEKSRNLMAVRLAQAVGMNKVSEYAARLGIYDSPPKQLTDSLGTKDTTLLRLTAAYAMLVNGGMKVTPTLIDRIQDRRGTTIFVHDRRYCNDCYPAQYTNQSMPRFPDIREQIVNPVSAYQMVSILEGAVQRGTAKGARSIGKPVAGKTGIATDRSAAWFVGFSPDLAIGIFVGFDDGRPLDEDSDGADTTAPIFREFMLNVLKSLPATPFRFPPGAQIQRVDLRSGQLTPHRGNNTILEAFKSDDRLPRKDDPVEEGDNVFSFSPPKEVNDLDAIKRLPEPPTPPKQEPLPGGLY